MSQPREAAPRDAPAAGQATPDPALERIQRDRQPGEIETGMMTGSDDSPISATDRFEGELSREEALRIMAAIPGDEEADEPADQE